MIKTMINKLAQEIHEGNKARGFYEGEKNIGEMLCLVHSEISEALEADRKGKYFKQSPNIDDFSSDNEFNDVGERYWKIEFESSIKDTFEDEIADAIIRLLDLAAFKSIDIEAHIKAKMRYNSLRPYKHGKKY